MNGSEHRRYRSLVQPSFVPNRAQWWIEHWIDATVHALIDRMEPDGRADLNTDLCAPIPLLTITGSFGVPIADALDIRAAVTSDGRPARWPSCTTTSGRSSPRAARSRPTT